MASALGWQTNSLSLPVCGKAYAPVAQAKRSFYKGKIRVAVAQQNISRILATISV
ncbi:hypothetical protein DPMN_167951 [Dreissena polymorpha]|uniref:Uncharacterized protein n=1 Tax=Dreissena polymorpha TaxID=45954 RepID=A0A9D4F2D6_DREPO|nr:hypothetical protein DPMN_167951 [Dreissena polymorpha]